MGMRNASVFPLPVKGRRVNESLEENSQIITVIDSFSSSPYSQSVEINFIITHTHTHIHTNEHFYIHTNTHTCPCRPQDIPPCQCVRKRCRLDVRQPLPSPFSQTPLRPLRDRKRGEEKRSEIGSGRRGGRGREERERVCASRGCLLIDLCFEAGNLFSLLLGTLSLLLSPLGLALLLLGHSCCERKESFKGIFKINFFFKINILFLPYDKDINNNFTSFLSFCEHK